MNDPTSLDTKADRCNAALEVYIAGARVRFAHQVEDTVGHRVVGITDDGMVVLDDQVGEFAPHLFVKLS